MRVLGVDVDRDLLGRWARWLAPPIQPFFGAVAGLPPSLPAPDPVLPEWRDTWRLWRLRTRGLPVTWLGEREFAALDAMTRRALLRGQVEQRRGAVESARRWAPLLDRHALRRCGDGRRFVWWPSLVGGARGRAVLVAAVGAGQQPSRHSEVPEPVWAAAAPILPGARALAGTFPDSSCRLEGDGWLGANCFATVMAAAGVPDADHTWWLPSDFDAWLGRVAGRGGRDGEPGTVLVWHDRDGVPQHAAVTIGGGWALEKGSQAWYVPRVVLPVADVLRLSRAPGQRLSRYRLT